MALQTITFSRQGNLWRSAPLECGGGDLRVRIHKKGLAPVDLLTSIDGVVEYLKHDDFGGGEFKCEVTIEGIPEGQYIMLSSCSEFELIKVLTA